MPTVNTSQKASSSHSIAPWLCCVRWEATIVSTLVTFIVVEVISRLARVTIPTCRSAARVTAHGTALEICGKVETVPAVGTVYGGRLLVVGAVVAVPDSVRASFTRRVVDAGYERVPTPIQTQACSEVTGRLTVPVQSAALVTAITTIHELTVSLVTFITLSGAGAEFTVGDTGALC